MKRITTFFTGLALSIFICACAVQKTVDFSAYSLTEKLISAASNWEIMTSVAPNSIAYTRIPQLGVRGRYNVAKSVLSKAMLESIVGEKAFLNSIHEGGMDYFQSKDFGRYNPAFLTKLQEHLTGIYANKIFVDNFQAFYDQELKRYLRTFYLTYEAGTGNQELKDRYVAMLNSPAGGGGFRAIELGEAFREVADSMEAQGYDWYEGDTCPGFWLRRSVDGTADEFYALLRLTIKTFDPQFSMN
jgi:hypothetical protein